jgi:hypothetical protein
MERLCRKCQRRDAVTVLDVFLGNSKPLDRALEALQAEDDKIFALQAGEEEESPIHAPICARRWAQTIARLRLMQAQNSAKSDRNLYATVFIGALLLAKGAVTPAFVGGVIVGIGKALAAL